MNKDKIWNIVLIISIILIIHGLTKTGSTDKKEAQAGQGEAILGAIGLNSIWLKKSPTLLFGITSATWKAIAMPLALLIAFLPNMIGSLVNTIKNIFVPQPSIPMWVYIAGFVVLLMMVTGRRR